MFLWSMFSIPFLRLVMHNSAAVISLIEKLPTGVSEPEFARVAEMHADHLSQIKRGKRVASQATVGRLKLAFVRIKARQLAGDASHNALFRSLLLIAAVEVGVDPVLAQTGGPSGSLENRELLKQARWIARYLMNVTLGFTMADIGRAEGVTKATVSASMPEIELLRDDPVFDEKLSRLELRLLGAS
jgi:hypothetical protein